MLEKKWVLIQPPRQCYTGHLKEQGFNPNRLTLIPEGDWKAEISHLVYLKIFCFYRLAEDNAPNLALPRPYLSVVYSHDSWNILLWNELTVHLAQCWGFDLVNQPLITPMFCFGFNCCDKCHDQKPLRRGKGLLETALPDHTPLPITEESQSRGSSKGWCRDHEGKLIATDLAFLNSRTHLPRDSNTHSGYSPSIYILAVKTMPQETSPQTNIMKAIPQLRFLFPRWLYFASNW